MPQVLSDSMVLTEDDGGLCLMMRVGDTFPNQTLDPVVRAYLYRWPGSVHNPGSDYTVRSPSAAASWMAYHRQSMQCHAAGSCCGESSHKGCRSSRPRCKTYSNLCHNTYTWGNPSIHNEDPLLCVEIRITHVLKTEQQSDGD